MGVTHHQAMSVTGTTTVSGNLQVSSAANSVCGLKSIVAGSAGAGVVSTSKVQASSRILLTPVATTANYKGVQAYVSTVASGSAFTVKLERVKTAGTIATASGRVSWLLINQ